MTQILTKPTKPVAPRKPKEPEKVMYKGVREISLEDGASLEYLISELDDLGVTDYSKVYFGIETGQDYYDTTYGYFSTVVEEVDPNYESNVAAYQVKLKMYEKKMLAHQDALFQYELDLIEYNRELVEQDKQRDLALLRELKEKYPDEA